jgi:LAO/AO transport system kinase
LGRAITLIESQLIKDQNIAQQILEKCLPFSGNALRIGITGIPGVGKSTFIEALGKYLINQGKKIAVLAVDPSSEKTKGSILGDKTRMADLASNPNAFIRPTPSSGTLGGVAQKTRESIILCEAAGFDIILIETVGVGQSETAVHSMVDLFLMLVLAGAGDELQGIKRGIMEMVDIIVINKSDDLNENKIKLTKQNYKNALHLMPLPESGWSQTVDSCSSITGKGINKIWNTIITYKNFTQKNGTFILRRKKQSLYWLKESIYHNIMNSFYGNKKIKNHIKKMEQDVLENKISPFKAAKKLIELWDKNYPMPKQQDLNP